MSNGTDAAAHFAVPPGMPFARPANADDDNFSGSTVPVGIGMASIARIPIPGTNGLFISITPRGYVPPGGSTSTLFLQDVTGKRHLRLDYGYNKTSGTLDYHWNQKGTFNEFGIKDHTTVGRTGEALYEGAKGFRYAGRILLVAGVALDLYSIVVAKKRWKQVARVVSGWTGSWAGCEVLGGAGAAAGSLEPGGGTALGGIAGCVAGGIAGYFGASWAAGHVYDWVEETYFEPVPEIPAEGQR